MALLGGESWEIYEIEQILDYWQFNGGIDHVTTDIIAGEGRCGGPAYFNSTIGLGPAKGVDFGTPFQGYAGWAQRLINFGSLSRFAIGAPPDGNHNHLTITMESDGSVDVWLGGPSALGGSVLGSLPPGTLLLEQWYHFGFEWFVDLTNGWFKLWLNGALALEVTGVRTVNPLYPVFIGDIEPVSIVFWSPLGYLSDMYWGDATGTDRPLSQTSYLYYPEVYQVNPVSGAPWTAATVDATELGLELTV